MNTKLKQMLRNLRASRLINYGTVAYQKISNDWYFEYVPTELRELWYGQDDPSFMSLSIGYDSEIDLMSVHELIRWIYKEYCLIARLEKIFQTFKYRK